MGKVTQYSLLIRLFDKGGDSLFVHLTNMIKTFIVHGNAPYYLLVCTLVPIVKDNLSDLSKSENYRAIAIGSLILKLLDWVILILEAENLETDQLQFGFEAMSSTTMCTWAVNTVVEHYMNKGKTVYACSMDCSKAFDMVDWVALFIELMKRGVKAVFVRLLMNIYKDQYCDVRWNGSYSHRFSISNGVRQGSVSSPILFSCYIDRLIKILRKSNIGCRIGEEYFGVFVFADDIFLLAASRPGLQAMVSKCEEFSKKNNLKFSTNEDPEKSKTKGIIFSKRPADRTGITPVVLCGNNLPWRDDLKLLGNIVQSANSMRTDNDVKRGKFIGKFTVLPKSLASVLLKYK